MAVNNFLAFVSRGLFSRPIYNPVPGEAITVELTAPAALEVELTAARLEVEIS